jgi:hypothetical protein
MPVIAFPATRDAKGEDLETESIAIGPRLRRLQPELVADLARSMAQIGQLSPIIVGDDGLIAGLHRLEAAKKLGWRTVRSVYTEDHSAGLLRLVSRRDIADALRGTADHGSLPSEEHLKSFDTFMKGPRVPDRSGENSPFGRVI